MNTPQKKSEEFIEKLRERSKAGFLSQICSTVTQIKPTEEPKQYENMDDLISSIFDE